VPLFATPALRLQAADAEIAEVPLVGDAASDAVDRAAIRTLFGAHQLLRLERLQTGRYEDATRDALLDALGYADDPLRVPEPPPLYAENTAKLQTPVVQKLLERESLRFGLVCSATAFVGERAEAGRHIETSVIVPSALPAGWSSAFVDAPRFAYFGEAAAMMAEIATDAALSSRAPLARVMPASPTPPWVLSYRGTPDFTTATACLTLVQDQAQNDALLSTARVWGDASRVDARLELWICIGTPHEPAVRVNLRELLELDAPRPLNIAVQRGEWVFLHLYAPTPWREPLPTLRAEVLSVTR
jgi:hypothetical protein